MSARNTFEIQYCRYCASDISYIFLRTTSRSCATGARTNNVTRIPEDQNCRSPLKTLRTSAKVRSSNGTLLFTMIATSAFCA